MASPLRPKQPGLPSKSTLSPTSQPLSGRTVPASPLPQAGIDPRTLTPIQIMQLQRTVGNRAVTQYMRANQPLLRGNAKAPVGPAVIQREEVKEEEVEKVWRTSNFKTIYLLKNGQLLSVHNKDGEIEKEFAAYQKIATAHINTPNPELVEYQGKKAIRMNKVEGTFVDFNKIPNATILYNLLIVRLSTEKPLDVPEAELRKLAHLELNKNKAPKDARKHLIAELATLLNAQSTVVISDLQAMVDHYGNLVVIDPLWAGDPSELKLDKKMVEETYANILEVFTRFGGKQKDLASQKDNKDE